MGSITEILFRNISTTELMIKIWEFSEHIHQNPPPDLSSCNCYHYLNLCIDAARGIWDNDNFIFVDTVIYRFQFCRERYFEIMNLPCHDQKNILLNVFYEIDRVFLILLVYLCFLQFFFRKKWKTWSPKKLICFAKKKKIT